MIGRTQSPLPFGVGYFKSDRPVEIYGMLPVDHGYTAKTTNAVNSGMRLSERIPGKQFGMFFVEPAA
jgi:hypothetical protein